MQAKKEPKTIEDWMHYAKELKLRIRKLEKKQADLVLKLSEPAYQSSATQSREKVVASAVSIHRSTVKIQKVWRGHRQRLKFKQELRRIANTNTSPGTSRPASNEVVIKGIFEVVKKQGLNLEMLFRACDKDMRGTIYLDDFKQFLRRLNLKLPLSKVNRFLHMLDEDCTGMIHRDEYLETLAAFSVNVERDNIKDHARTYEQECMLRFAGSLKKQGITPEEVCNFCDSTNGKTIRGIKLAKFAANMSDGFFEKEIKGLRTFFDADNTGFIDKEFFIQQMKKAQDLIDKEPSLGARVRSPEKKTDLRASLAASSRSFKTTISIEKEDMGEGDQSFQPSSFRKSNNAINKPSIKKEQSSPIINVNKSRNNRHEEEEEDDRPVTPQQKTNQRAPSKDSKPGKLTVQGRPTREQASPSTHRVRDESPAMTESTDIKRVVVKMELESKPIHEFLYNLLVKMKDVSKGITLAELTQMIEKEYAKVITPQEKTLLLKNIDANSNAAIDVNEIKNFALNLQKCSKENVLSLKLVTIMLARTLEVQGISTGRFLLSHGITPSGACPIETLASKLGPEFELEESDSVELFKDLDQHNTGACELKAFIKNIDSLRSDLKKYKGEDLSKVTENQDTKNQKPPTKPQAKNKNDHEEEEHSAAPPKNKTNQKQSQGRPTREQDSNSSSHRVRDESPAMAESTDIKRVVVKMELESKPIHEFLYNLLIKMKDVSKGITLAELTQMIDKEYAKVITPQEKTLLLKNIDANSNAAIDVNEIKNFALNLQKCSKENVLSLKLVTIMLARTLEVQGISTGRFLLSHGIALSGACPIETLASKLGPEFELEESDSVELFKDLDQHNTGACELKAFIKNIDSLRGDLKKYKGEDLSKVTENQDTKSQKPPTKAQAKNKNDHEEEEEEHSAATPKNKTNLPAHKVKDESPAMTDSTNIKRIVVKMELESKPIHEFLYNLLVKMKDVSKGITVAELTQMIEKEYAKVITPQEKTLLLKNIDANSNAAIDVNEVKNFALNLQKCSKENVLSLKLVTIMLARTLEVQGISTGRFLLSHGITPSGACPIGTLASKLGPEFELEESDSVELFKDLDQHNTGACELKVLIKNIDSNRSDLKKYKGEDLSKVAADHDTKNQKQPAKPQAKNKNDHKEEDEEEYHDEDHVQHKDEKETLKSRTNSRTNSIKITESDETTTKKLIKKIISQMELENKPICNLLEFILREVKDPREGVPIAPIMKKISSEWGSILSKPEQMALIKELDPNKSGDVNAKELLAFVLKWAKESKEQILSLTVILMLIAKVLQVDGVSTEEFLTTIHIDPSKPKIPIKVFADGIDDYFEMPSDHGIEIFHTLDNGSGTVDTALFISRIDGYRNLNSQETTAIKRQKEDWSLESLKTAIRAKGIEPMSIFEKACKKGQDYTTVAAIKSMFDKTVPDFPKADLTKVMQIIDADKNGFVNRDEFQMLILDKIAAQTIAQNATKSVASKNSSSDKTDYSEDPIVLKFMRGLQDSKLTPEKFFDLADPNGDHEVDLFEIKNIIKKDLPKSNLSISDIAKLMKIIDSSGNGLIEKQEFIKFSGNADAWKNALKLDLKVSGRQASGRQASNTGKVASNINDSTAQADAEKMFDELMSKYKITDKDKFEVGKKKWGTIFNSQMAALKYCHEVVKKLESEGKKYWDDPEFGPTEHDKHGKASIYVKNKLSGYPDPEQIYWFRPQEISATKPPEFIDDGAKCNDVMQGAVGDCWLIGAISVLATNDEYIRGNFNPTPEATLEISDEEASGMVKGIYPPIFHFLRRYGIFVFKLFKNYEWRYIVIDDKLPCDKQEECPPLLTFGRCKNTNEFWVPLIEKAYAKIHNCYEALIAGYLDDGLTDMTGLVSEKIKIQGANGALAPDVGTADALWIKIKGLVESGSMLGCSVSGQEGELEHEVTIDDEPVGILKNHAYSIIDVLEVPNPKSKKAHKSHRLLRIRNPWGNLEWNQKWSDGSTKLTQNLKSITQYIKEKAAKTQDFEEFDPEANDGTFIMCFKDWRSIYNNLFASVHFPAAWSGIRYFDEWNKENSGGTPLRANPTAAEQWAKNPQFIVSVKKEGLTKLFISLGQPDGRLIHGLKFPFKDNIHAACFAICRLDEGEKMMKKFDPKRVLKISILKEYREISMEFEAKPGNYAIIPSTQEAGQFGQFFLNIYFDCPKDKITISKANSNLKWSIIAEEEETVDHFDDNLKKILKLKANAVIFSHDDGIMGAVKIGPKVVGGSITNQKPKDAVNTVADLKTTKTMSRSKATASNLKTDEISRTVKVDLQDGQKKFDQYLAKIKLTNDDYFMGRKTVLNSLNATLKVTNDIVAKLKASGKAKWDDPDFGGQHEDDHAASSIFIGEPGGGLPNPDDIFWCRPEEISTEIPPVFLDQGASSGDVLQGTLGDCWFIGALAIIGAHDIYLRGQFDPSPEAMQAMSDKEAAGMTSGIYCPVFHYLRQYGIYVIRFYKEYSWRYVIIDDKLPCYKQEGCPPQLVFARCKKEDEFWVPLVEKAYAKLFNCYQALTSGYLDDALNDMTGHVNRKLWIQSPKGFPSEDTGDKDAFWNVLKEYVDSSTLLGCSVQGKPGETEHQVEIDGAPVGILKSHAYSLIDVVEVPNPASKNKHKTHRLLRVRNPWGNTEWQGDWSDGSTKLMSNIEKINSTIKELSNKYEDYEPFDPECDDGTFLINYRNWRDIYSNLFCCIDFPEEWSGIRTFDKWTKDCAGGTPLQGTAKENASWAKNPQYKITVNNKKAKKTHMFISLGQKDGRLVRGMKFPFVENIQNVCFAIVRLDSGEKKASVLNPKKVVTLSMLKQFREISADIQLDNGSYVIIPSTEQPGQVGDYVLNVYFSCAKNEFAIEKVDGEIKWEYIIEEEEDTEQKFDDEIKVFLKMKYLFPLFKN